MISVRRTTLVALALSSIGLSHPALAEWKPVRPVEFVVAAGAGGGTDQFARVVQAIIQKYQLMPVSVIVSNKGGGGATEAFVYARTMMGDPHKLVFSTNLSYLMPMITKVGYKIEEMRPVAAMAADEFLLWTYKDAPYKTTKDFLDAARQKDSKIRMGGSQSKDTDHILTRQIERAAGIHLTYIPFKSGGEVGVQLAGGHVDANTNNPSENISHWKAGLVRPLCVFSAQRLSEYSEKINGDLSFADIPTCKESGIPIDQFSMPRTVWMPGKTTDEQVQYYVDVLSKVRETDDWKEWLRKGTQTGLFLTGTEFEKYIAADKKKHLKQFTDDGWLIRD